MKLRLSGATMNAVADIMHLNRRTVYLYLRGYTPMSDNFRASLNEFLVSHHVEPLVPVSTTDEANFKVAQAIAAILDVSLTRPHPPPNNPPKPPYHSPPAPRRR